MLLTGVDSATNLMTTNLTDVIAIVLFSYVNVIHGCAESRDS